MYLEESMVKSIGLNTYNDDILSFLDSKIKSFYNLTQGLIWRFEVKSFAKNRRVTTLAVSSPLLSEIVVSNFRTILNFQPKVATQLKNRKVELEVSGNFCPIKLKLFKKCAFFIWISRQLSQNELFLFFKFTNLPQNHRDYYFPIS